MITAVLMHQGVGLDAFNSLPTRRAVHALYECVNSVTMAADLAKGRRYADHAALFREADALLFSMPEESIDHITTAHPRVGRRPGSTHSHSEQCSLFDPRPGVMHLLAGAAVRYAEKFGFEFVMHVSASDSDCSASAVISVIGDRMYNDTETERKVVRNEIAKINRSRLERMLGPEGGYDNWI